MMERTLRRARPSLEGLEGRALLNGSKIPAVQTQAAGAAIITAETTNRFDYTTAGGAKVRIQLNGPGNLTGTALDSNGNLNLVFSGTSIFTSIIGTVRGGSGQASLGSIRNANVPLNSTTGVGGELMGRISLPEFNLVSGGNINLLAGVNELSLNSVAANSQLHLRDTPLNTTLGISTTVDPLTGAGLGYPGNQPYHSTTVATSGTSGGTSATTGLSGVNNPGTIDPTVAGFGGTGVGAINGAIPILPTIGNGQNYRGTPGLTQAQVSYGRALAYAFESTNANAILLTNVGGSFNPGSNLVEPRDISLPGFRHIPPPGVILNINHVNGASPNGNAPLGDPNIYGFDPSTSRLIRFDATTGAVLSTITVPGATSTAGLGGVALARNGTELVALVGVGQTVRAYDALSGVFVGQFTTLRPVGGIATSEGSTILVDSTETPDGVAQVINIPGSLAVGSAVPVGAPFGPAREFLFGGGVTGIAGSGNVFALGAGFFDTAQPNLMQAGILTLAPSSSGTLTEVGRAPLISQGIDVPANAGTIANDPSRALGSIESNLALDTGVSNGRNVIALLSPSSLATQGQVTFNYPNALSDLSESFHPEIAGTALIDVQGNIQSFTAKTATGMVLNDAGNLNQLSIKTATNSSVVGLPFGHVSIQNRNNVSIVTNSRLVGERGNVTVVPGARQVGPLTLPS